MKKRLFNEEETKYFIKIVKGHTNKEVIKLFNEKYNRLLTNEQVNNQKRSLKLKSGVFHRWTKEDNPNYRPIGHEYITSDGYIQVKIAQPSTYKFKHHIIWEQANGKIPEDCYIMFLDGDRTNLSLDNLKLVKKNDLRTAISSNLTFKNKELTETGLLIAQLKNKEKEKINMGNIWKKLNKMNKSNYEISQETNIPEEKVEEIMRGERQVPTDRVDDFRKALSINNKAERSLKLAQVKQWYKETDLKEAREKLGYKSQASLARAMNLSASTMSRIEGKVEENSKYFNEDTLIRYYDFLNNELNKVIETKANKGKKITRKRNKQPKIYVDYEILKNWYENTDIKKWLDIHNITTKELADAIGYNSTSTIYDAIHLKFGFDRQRKSLTRIYKFIKDYELKDKIVEDENIEILDESDIDDNIEYNDKSVESECIIRPSSEKGKILRLEYELEEARKQIARYEKLIDMIGGIQC